MSSGSSQSIRTGERPQRGRGWRIHVASLACSRSYAPFGPVWARALVQPKLLQPRGSQPRGDVRLHGWCAARAQGTLCSAELWSLGHACTQPLVPLEHRKAISGKPRRKAGSSRACATVDSCGGRNRTLQPSAAARAGMANRAISPSSSPNNSIDSPRSSLTRDGSRLWQHRVEREGR